MELIEADDCDHAIWWRQQFEVLPSKQQRKLLKQPIMTFAYSVKAFGAATQIAKVYKGPKPPVGVFIYKKVKNKWVKRPGPAFTYLAKKFSRRVR